ncbi:N-acetylmuramoyl-L-alanine amidase family protein [Winogradskyella immobilis]|uniref:N-acetylmuramoyl-L-alanine amidase n=1 Tax=Winogradskyella immobilis TaxID=2816852 RepID=A0ABS8ENA9_9FLAO|nr:N-acetylmuramoyl-L-alanine amidase [Winogradskyella immobilis]MCC1484720.1 N-acetylmuramoyl-L-alanine amidase [Winogradskyella immobilis]MCG0016812.1 N-acetylmuramoyl-L-alanine amidase [Winogradskyella immobilis]
MYKYTLIFIICLTSTLAFGQSKDSTVVAKRGDGIYSLLKAHNIAFSYADAFIELNKTKLTSSNGLIAGKTYTLPIVKVDSITKAPLDSKLKIKEPLFGKKYSEVTIENDKLKNNVYYLISGHGGPDPGATTTYNSKLISEDEYAYDVTLRLARKLMENGAKVYIIIKDKNDGIRDQRVLEVDYDEVAHPNNKIPRNHRLRLQQRTKAVNNLYQKHKGAYQRLVVTHVDSRNTGKNVDVFFYHHKNSKSGKRLADNILKSFRLKYAKHQPNREYSGSVSARSGLYLIKNTTPAMVYIELGNIKNAKDQRRILNYENREALANWIHNGLLMDFEENH